MGHLLLRRSTAAPLGRRHGLRKGTKAAAASLHVQVRAVNAARPDCGAGAAELANSRPAPTFVSIRVALVSFASTRGNRAFQETPAMLKSLIVALSVVVVAAGLMPADADAKRLGGGGSSGMQRSMPTRTPEAAPARPAQAAPTAPATPGVPAAAPRRSWMGPIAGLAAGLGIAALMSHFGMGGAMGNILTMLLLAGLAFFAIRFVMSRFARGPAMAPMATPGGMQFAGNGPVNPATTATGGSGWGEPQPATAASTTAAWQQPQAKPTRTLPAGFDAASFERIAKMIFIRMQTANDNADLNDLRTFTTPEMYATIKIDLQERGSAAQRTEVVRVDAEVLDVTAESDRQVVSVRFHGLIREEVNGQAAPFDEAWHLVKPTDGSRDWLIAGIQQTA
jgi:predicted lipid-binding transport protein (Tim44 family)